MKTVTWLLLFCVPYLTLPAQGVFSNQTNIALQKVIQDYPYHFRHIKGELIASKAHIADYRSKVEIPGAVNCLITQYEASSNELYNWQCELFTGSTFEEAQQKFRASYDQIRNSIIKIDEKAFILNGRYEAPSEDRKVTCIHFNMLPNPEGLHKLKVTLTLQYTNEWKILLSVYDQERGDDRAAVAVQ